MNEVHEISPILLLTNVSVFKSRDQIVYTRCRLGHSRMTQVCNIRRLPNMYLLPESVILETCFIRTGTDLNPMRNLSFIQSALRRNFLLHSKETWALKTLYRVPHTLLAMKMAVEAGVAF